MRKLFLFAPECNLPFPKVVTRNLIRAILRFPFKMCGNDISLFLSFLNDRFDSMNRNETSIHTVNRAVIGNLVKVKLLLLFCLLCCFAFTGLCCNDGPTKPAPDISFALTAEDITCTEVYLRLTMGTDIVARQVTLKRDTITLFTRTIGDIETIILDTNLVPGHTYTYQAQVINCTSASCLTNPLQIRTLDTTSHSISWSIDTLGAQGVIRDVWVFDRNNAWAVGEIEKDGIKYNVAKWDGQEWSLSRILYQGGYAPIRFIFAFNENDIWFGIGYLIHWNGSNYSEVEIPAFSGVGSNKMWGSHGGELYVVGNNGTIAYSSNRGSTWTQMTSNTTVDLEDIYGLDANHVWAVGTMVDYSRSVILSFNGTTWNTLYEGSYYGFSSVWTNKGRRLYVAGPSGPWKLDLSNLSFNKLITPSQYIMYCVKATSINDIFMTGFGEAIHFNGSSWILYPEITSINSGLVYWYAVKPIHDFVIIGGGYYTGYNSAPIVLRGYR